MPPARAAHLNWRRAVGPARVGAHRTPRTGPGSCLPPARLRASAAIARSRATRGLTPRGSSDECGAWSFLTTARPASLALRSAAASFCWESFEPCSITTTAMASAPNNRSVRTQRSQSGGACTLRGDGRRSRAGVGFVAAVVGISLARVRPTIYDNP